MSRRAVVSVAALSLAAAGLALLPSASAGPGKAVSGSVHQAYRATPRADWDAEVIPTKQDGTYRGPQLDVSASYIGRDAAEPTIGVTSGGFAFFAAGAFDGIGGQARTKIMASRDSGKTWKSVQRELPTGNGMPPNTLDPYVYVDPDTDRIFSVDLYVGCSILSYSDDNGETWTDNPYACGIPVNDHQTAVTGRPPAGMPAPVGYEKYVYYCVNQVADVNCARSLDGGDTFQPSGAPAYAGVDGGFCGGLHGHVVTDPEGRLYVPKGHCGKPWVAVSEDAGLTWSRYRVSDIPTSGIQTAITSDDEGNLYYVWWDGDDRLPYMAVSKDHGRTWGTPVMIAPPGVMEVNYPSIAASGKGRVAITFPGTRSDDRSDGERPWNYYVITTTNALASKPLFVSATANKPSDPIHRGACNGRCGGMFDFLDVVIAPTGEIWAAATDTCTSENKCNTKDAGAASDMKGMAVRQIGGPGMPKKKH
jgi:hypothetical protein